MSSACAYMTQAVVQRQEPAPQHQSLAQFGELVWRSGAPVAAVVMPGVISCYRG